MDRRVFEGGALWVYDRINSSRGIARVPGEKVYLIISILSFINLICITNIYLLYIVDSGRRCDPRCNPFRHRVDVVVS
jgi:hypothetical protein